MGASPWRDQAEAIMQNPEAAAIAGLASLYRIYDREWWDKAWAAVEARNLTFTNADVVKEYEEEKVRNPR